MKTINIYVYICALCVISQSAVAQDTTAIATEKVEVIKNYEAIIKQAQRKKINTEVPVIENRVIDFNYALNSEARLDFDRPDEIIRPVSYDPIQKTEDIKDGNVYATYGNYNSLGLGAAYHYYIEDWLDIGIKADHFSAKDNSLPHQKYNTTKAQFYGSYYLSQQTKAGAEFRFNSSDHFSPITTTSDSLGATAQAFRSFGGALNLSSNVFESAGLSLRTRLDFDRLEQTVDTVDESLFKGEINVLKRINRDIALEIPAEYRHYSLNVLDMSRESLSDILLKPNIRYRSENYAVMLGAEYIKADSIGFIFPVFELRVDDIYADISVKFYTSSRYNRNSMHYLSGIDPYYITSDTPMDVNYLRSYNLEVSKAYKDWTFSILASYNDYTGDDMHIDRANLNRNLVQSLDRNEWRINPRIQYTSSILSAQLGYTYNIFLDGTENILLYRPKSNVNLNLEESFMDGKLKLQQGLHYSSSRNIDHPSDADGLLDSFWDLSASVELSVVKNVQVFARGTNLLANEYDIWFNHPVLTRQFWAGLSFNL